MTPLCADSEEIKGYRSSGYGGEKGGGRRPEPCQEETINARVSVEAVRTLEHQPLVTAVLLRISEDCSHVRDRCTERVCSPRLRPTACLCARLQRF